MKYVKKPQLRAINFDNIDVSLGYNIFNSGIGIDYYIDSGLFVLTVWFIPFNIVFSYRS